MAEELNTPNRKKKETASLLESLLTNYQDERLEKHLIPPWGDRPIIAIRQRDAIELIEKIAATKPGVARNVLLAARAMFTYARRREMVEYKPFSEVGLAVPAATANDRDRTLSDDELKGVVFRPWRQHHPEKRVADDSRNRAAAGRSRRHEPE
jgi:hypothetical protein